MSSAPNVLPLFDPPVRKSYRAAVKQCVENAKRISGLTWDDLSEKLGCSKDTLTNAVTEENDLSGVTLLRIGYVYGEEAIAPALELFRRRYRPARSSLERFDDAMTELALVRRELLDAMESA